MNCVNHDKVKICEFLNLSINPFFNKCLYNFFFFFFSYIYIKMSKNLPAKYYEENKERLQQKSL